MEADFFSRTPSYFPLYHTPAGKARECLFPCLPTAAQCAAVSKERGKVKTVFPFGEKHDTLTSYVWEAGGAHDRFRHRPGRSHHRIRGGACGASENTLVQYGVITTPPGIPLSSRLLQISDDMEELIRTFHPDEMAVEELFFTKNITTGIAVAHGRGSSSSRRSGWGSLSLSTPPCR